MAQPLTIGRLAQTTGVAARTIRYYEQVGVLPPPSRTAGGYRQYTDQGVERLLFIRRARALGLPLQTLKGLTRALGSGSPPTLRPRLLELIRTQLDAVQRRIGELEVLQRQLEHVVQRLETPRRGSSAGKCRCLETESPGSDPDKSRG